MDKGYYARVLAIVSAEAKASQSTIKMDKGYYMTLIH